MLQLAVWRVGRRVTPQEEKGHHQFVTMEVEREEGGHAEIGRGGQEERTQREVEEDIRFSEDMADLKTRILKLKVMKSLESLTVFCICDNIDFFLKNPELFNCLRKFLPRYKNAFKTLSLVFIANRWCSVKND